MDSKDKYTQVTEQGVALGTLEILYQNCLDLRRFGDDVIITSRVSVAVGRNRDLLWIFWIIR